MFFIAKASADSSSLAISSSLFITSELLLLLLLEEGLDSFDESVDELCILECGLSFLLDVLFFEETFSYSAMIIFIFCSVSFASVSAS